MEKRWSIRAAVAGDGPLVLEMIQGLAEYEKLAQHVTATVEDIEKTMLAPGAQVRCLLGFSDGQPAGFAVFFRNYSTFQGKYGLYLEDIFVRPDFRGIGLGRGLLETVISLGREENCGRVEWVALDWNQPAIDFYEKLGAEALREWVRFRLTLV